MIQICIMGGQGGLLRPEKRFFLTLMGGCELQVPTVARQILAARRRPESVPRPPRTQYFVTIMGATEIKLPTLAAEYVDLRELLGSGALTMSDWDRGLADVVQTEHHIASFTLMGGFEDSVLPAEDEEIESLALQRHMGNVSDSAGRVLQLGIGQRDPERRATIRRAVTADV